MALRMSPPTSPSRRIHARLAGGLGDGRQARPVVAGLIGQRHLCLDLAIGHIVGDRQKRHDGNLALID
jgi:hypothetical protein